MTVTAATDAAPRAEATGTGIRVLHIIPNLAAGGGAQSALYRLIDASPDCRHEVVMLIKRGALGDALAARGVPTTVIGLRGLASLPGAFIRLRSLLSQRRPDIVQTWMYHADLLGGCAARLAGCRRVVWNLRHGTLDPRGSSLSSRSAARLCAALSRHVPVRIVSCSAVGAEVHAALGYEARRMRVIPNGYDTGLFRPLDAGKDRAALRGALGLPPTGTLLGMAARWDAQKDHAMLFEALGALRDRQGSEQPWHCVLFGARMDADNAALARSLERHGLAGRVHLLGLHDDVPALMPLLDVALLSSRFGEGFPNVLAEAMLCGTPCITTDVGDAARIVGDTGWVTPPGQAPAFAAALRDALARVHDVDAWQARRDACRTRIVEHFGIRGTVDAYRALWAELP